MANYIVTYDLNGSTPTHAQMDKHVSSKTNWARGRILETVWYIGTTETQTEVFNHFNAILSSNDRLIVITASDARFRNLLVGDDSLKSSWSTNR